MRCTRALDLVDRAARREDLERGGELGAHLAACPACAAEAARHLALLELLEGVPSPKAPPGLRAKILDRLDEEPAPFFPYRWAAAALLLLGLTAGFILGRALLPSSPEEPPALLAAVGENLNGGPWSAAQNAVLQGVSADPGRRAP